MFVDALQTVYGKNFGAALFLLGAEVLGMRYIMMPFVMKEANLPLLMDRDVSLGNSNASEAALSFLESKSATK